MKAKKISMVILTTTWVLSACSGKPANKEVNGVYAPKIKAEDLSSTVNSKYFTLTPGRGYVYVSGEDGEERIEVDVLDKTKKVFGTEVTEVRDRVYEDGELIEESLDWFAQDGKGNVWYLGEDSRDFEDGEVVGTAGSWEAGVAGALPGLIMYANPIVGEEYRQEYYMGEAEDMGMVVSLKEAVEVEAGAYEDCIKTLTWDPMSEFTKEYKYYCAGAGVVVLEEDLSSGDRVELVEIR